MDIGRLRFRILGPLQLCAPGGPVPVKGTKRRLLLARFLVDRGRVLTVEQLADTLWPDGPPRSAAANLQTYVHDLRALLSEAQSSSELTTTGGYVLKVADGELDLDVFEHEVERARTLRADGDRQHALDALDEAIRLRRGEPLEDLPAAASWEAELARVGELMLTASEERVALNVELGRHRDALAAVRPLLIQHPFRETLWQQLMLAHYGLGQRADALQAYAGLRERLADELGVDPGHELSRTHQAILTGEVSVPTERTEPPEQPRQAQPAQLPADVADFVGRDELVGELVELFSRQADAPIAAVLSGAPGAGKSALAVHVAHRVRPRFPDGQLYLDCAGTGTVPKGPAEALALLLRALGVPDSGLPDELEERAALYRSLLADRRMLVVLDDAAEVTQLRHLMPATGGCALLATARRLLGDVVGAHQFTLDGFQRAESERLLAAITGEQRVRAEPEAAAEIIRACGNLPLAIRIVGARLAGRKAWPLAVLADRLTDESRRLNELELGELGVRASFELSVRQLGPDEQRAFRRLGLLAATSFPGWVVRALLDDHDGRTADAVLDRLVDANLVQLGGTDAGGQPRYQLHDLVHCHAAEHADAEPADERAAAVARVLGGWLSLAERAASALPVCFGAALGDAPRWRLPDATAGRLVADPAAWFAAESEALAQAVALASDRAPADGLLAGLAWELAVVAVPYFDLRGRYEDWRQTHERALPGVRAAGDERGEAALLRGLGQVYIYRDHYPEAEAAMQRSLRLYRAVRDERGEAVATAGLATIRRLGGHHEEALAQYRRALTGLQRAGDRHGVAQIHNAIGAIQLARGRTAQAVEWGSSALELAREVGDRHREAKALMLLGSARLPEGAAGDVLSALRDALRIFQDIDDTRCTADAQVQLARAWLELGRTSSARAAFAGASYTFYEIGDRMGQAKALRYLGALELRDGDSMAARYHQRQADELWPGDEASRAVTPVARPVDDPQLDGTATA